MAKNGTVISMLFNRGGKWMSLMLGCQFYTDDVDIPYFVDSFRMLFAGLLQGAIDKGINVDVEALVMTAVGKMQQETPFELVMMNADYVAIYTI